MKRSVLLISAFAVFGLLFTQCKKNQEVLPVIPSGEKIDVTLNVPNNGGSKTGISDDGSIVWSGNDKIVVCLNDQNVSTKNVAGILSLKNNSGSDVATFEGSITLFDGQTTDNFTLHTYDFYYLGSNFDEDAISNGEYTLDFTNQDGTLAGLSKLHYAKGTGSFKNVNGKYTANLNLLNKTCLFSYNVTAMVNNISAIDNFYLTFPNSMPNTKITISFTKGGCTFDNTTKSIYVGKPTKQSDNLYKLYVILPGNDAAISDIDVRFFSDSYSQNDFITHHGEHFTHNSYNGGDHSSVTKITDVTNISEKGCARGIFKTATGRLVRFAKGNLKTEFDYDNNSASNFRSSLHNSQVEGFSTLNSTDKFSQGANNAIDHYAFGATGLDGALNSQTTVLKPTSIYCEFNFNWYYNSTSLTDDYDFGKMLGDDAGFHTMTSDDFSAFDGFYKSNFTYSETSFSKFDEPLQVLMITKDKPSEIINTIEKADVTTYENKYNAIFFINSGYTKHESSNGGGYYVSSPSFYWIADGYDTDHIRVMSALNGTILNLPKSESNNGSGTPVRLVHTEFDPNSSNQ